MTDLEPDDAGRLFETYRAVIRRASDGEVRTYDVPTQWHSSAWFWWAEGNGSCDCNRSADFDRADGMPEDEVWNKERPCGEGRYQVLKFVFPDGSELAGPDV